MNKISTEMLKEFSETYKVGLMGTIDDDGYPHISLISSLQALNEKQMISGQFITGLSSKNVENNKKMGFLIMSLEKKWWNGKALWKEKKTNGQEYEMYNNIPMFRYNSYFGIHTVHYYDLIEVSNANQLNMAGIIKSALLNFLTKGKYKDNSIKALKPWAYKLLSGLAELKFICFFDKQGYPKIVPIIQAQACDNGRIVIPAKPYREEMKDITNGAKAAIIGMNMDMLSVVVQGTIKGFENSTIGYLNIEKVYNSMPPKHGYIYGK